MTKIHFGFIVPINHPLRGVVLLEDMRSELEPALVLGFCNLDAVARTALSSLAQESLDEGQLLPYAETLAKHRRPFKSRATREFLKNRGVDSFWMVLPSQDLLDKLEFTQEEAVIFCQVYADLEPGQEKQWTYSVTNSYPTYPVFTD